MNKSLLNFSLSGIIVLLCISYVSSSGPTSVFTIKISAGLVASNSAGSALTIVGTNSFASNYARWYTNSTGYIFNYGAAVVLDVHNNGTTATTPVSLWHAKGGLNQLWTITSSNGNTLIISKASGLYFKWLSNGGFMIGTEPISISLTNYILPTIAPTPAPTHVPTKAPTTAPTVPPTTPPTTAPTVLPTTPPTTAPTESPTTPPPAGSCQNVQNPIDGNIWQLTAIPDYSLSSSGYGYDVDFCGVEGCANNGQAAAGCQSGFRSLGWTETANITFVAAGEISISVNNGYVDYGCGSPRVSVYNLFCADVTTVTGTVSGGCGYDFELQIPLVYCS